MATSTINSSAPVSSNIQLGSKPSNKTSASNAQAEPSPLSRTELGRKQQNLAILESQQQVSLSAKNEPLALILKAAIEGINQELEPYLGANAIESAAENKVDVSPEATAERIVSQSTAFFSAFQEQNNKLSFEEQLEKFLGVIGGGIDQGFEEARTILEGLQVLEGDIADNIDKTYDLVQQGLEGFRQRQLQEQ